MVRLDDNELNIHPQVAAALRHLRPEFVEETVAHRIRTEQSDVAENLFDGFRQAAEVFVRILLWIFGAVVIFVAAVLVVSILGWLYALFATTPQQGQLGASGAPGVATRHPQTYRPPRRARQQHPRYRTGTSLRLSAHRKMSRPKSAHLPPTVDASAIRKIKSAHSSDSLSLHRLRVQRSPRQRAGTTLIHKPPAIPRQYLSRYGWQKRRNGHEPFPTQ